MSSSIQITSVIRAIDQMVREGIIDSYAIGGALAATLYDEPIATVDLDIFFIFKNKQTGVVLSLDEIYDFASRQGYAFDHEFIRIDDWLVQFVESSHSPLWSDAIANARQLTSDGLSVPVIDPEHLIAMWLFAGRPKDYQKISIFLESGLLDLERLKDLLRKHGLMIKWEKQQWRFSESD